MEKKFENIKKAVELGMSEGRIVTVNFIKKDGTIRTMNARKGVKKHLKGGKSTISHKSNLIGCFDMQNGGYRCINAETVISMKAAGLPEQIFQTETEARQNVECARQDVKK